MKICLDVHVETLRNTSFDVRLKIKSLKVAGFTPAQNQLLLDFLPVELERALLTQAIDGPEDRRQRTRRTKKAPARPGCYISNKGRTTFERRSHKDRRKHEKEFITQCHGERQQAHDRGPTKERR